MSMIYNYKFQRISETLLHEDKSETLIEGAVHERGRKESGLCSINLQTKTKVKNLCVIMDYDF